ncbi:MAG: hypothetical protein U5Q16_01670 [Gammaproteobacteria bacterium]|nr:hypothetical protein [Gammaproteobacteria bacterium]
MRFLVGLISGAALMLLLAQILAVPDGRWRERTMALLDSAVTAGRQALSDAPADAVEPTVADATDEANPSADEEPQEDLAGVEEPASQPIPRPPDPFPLVSEEDTQSIVEQVFESPRRQPQAVTETRSQVVWVPFHSEMSANGFAQRLSAALDHRFDVERRGPGRYEVVFDYRDEPERDAVLSEAAQVTGLPL